MRDDVLDPSNVGDSAYRRLRADIVFGRLSPGQRLTLDRMKDAYGASVSTLREVLNRLASEGLATAEGARGFEVAPISAANLREVAKMRLLLEGHALEESFANGDMEWEGRVVSAHHKLASIERRLLAGDASPPETWKRYDWEFHHALISACGSRVLLDTHSAIYDKYLRYQMLAAVFRGEVAAGEHRRLLECALSRDAAGAKATLRTHVDECVDRMLAGGRVESSAAARAA